MAKSALIWPFIWGMDVGVASGFVDGRILAYGIMLGRNTFVGWLRLARPKEDT